MGKAERPLVWAYRDARKFTAEQIHWLRGQDKRVSFRKLSLAANLGSPNYIQQFISGERNIKRETARSLAVALGLDIQEQQYFEALVKFSQLGPGQDQLGAYQDLLKQALRSGNASLLDHARMSYFTEWYVPVVHAMASLSTFRANPEWIASRIIPPIRVPEAQYAIDTLVDLGIFEFKQTGRKKNIVVREPQLETDPGLQGLWVREYHRAMIRLSERALDVLSPADRTTAAMTVTVPHALVAEVLDKVDRYRRDLFAELMERQNDDKPTDGVVMQINFQAFPLMDTQK